MLLRWTVPPQSDISGYRVYSGAASQTYNSPIDTGLLPAATLNGVVYYLYRNLQLATPYYVAVTAYNTSAMESDYSNEKLWNISAATPPPVNAGPDLSGSVGQLFTLGSASQLGVSYYWEQTAGTPVSLSSRTASSTQFSAATAGTFQFTLTAYDTQGVAAQDVVNVIVTAPATSTPTATRTPTPSATRTPTPSVTATRTLTPSPSRTPTTALTTTATPTRTLTPSVTATRTLTPSPSKTPTPVASPTPTPSRTSTATSTPSSTATRTPTSALSPTPTLSPRPTLTSTETPTYTPTAIPTDTPSPTLSPTPSPPPICATILPNGLGALMPQNERTGCTDGWQCLRSDDADVSYVFSQSTTAIGPRSDIYALDDMGPQDGVVASVTVRIMSRSLVAGSGSSATPLLKVNGNSQLFEGLPLATSTDYQEAETSFIVNPARNQSWTWADIDGLQAGVRHQVGPSDEVRTTSVSVLVCFVPTGPTRTPTSTATATPTATTTDTSTVTPTITDTPMRTATASATATATAVQTATPTNTSTPTSTPTFTATVTMTPSKTATPTGTLTPSVTATWTLTPSPTRTSTASLAPTLTATSTRAPTADPTVTCTATLSPTTTPTQTSTATPPATRTATQVLTATPTATWTGTATLTATAPPLPTKTPTLTPTASSTATLSPTPTPSRTSTATSTPSATATRTPTSALVPTPTLTPSPTPTTITTATPSPAPSLTPQPSPICATLLPNGPGAFVPENQGSGCTDGWQCLRSEDGDGSYVFSPIATTFALRSDIYALDDMGPQDGVVTSVTIRIISRSLIGGSGSSAVPLLKVNGSSQLFDGPPLATSTEYQEAESTYVKNPAWNQSWTWADMDGLQAGVRHQVAATDEVRTTSVSALVCFLPTGPTSTPTPTRTATPIPTITPTRSATPSTTSTPTPTPSYSPTSTPTAKPTDTRTPTFAPSLTVTPTPSFTATATSTVSPTASATSTFTAAPTHTPEPSATPTGTATATVTSTATPSPPPTVTPTDTATPPPSVTPTPTVPTETPTPAATETPTSTATRTPTATPTPLPNDGLASLLGITMRGSHGSMFSVQHVSQSASGGSGAEDQPELSVQTDGVLAAGAFPSEGVRGAKDLVIWKANNAALPPSSMLEVYRLESDRPPQRLTYTELSGPAGPAVDPTVLSGDVDPSSVGNEIVVVGGDSAGRSARVCVFGGMVDEQLHLLSDFYMPRRAVGDKPSVPAIGHVLPDSRYAGAEIIIGGERGRVYAVGLDHGHAVLLSVLRAFKDRPKASARRLAVGDVIPDIPGDEIVVADDGTVGDALVRVFDSQTQRVVAEFEAFAPGAAPAGVELWVGDVLTAFPGAELLVGEGPAGGRVSVFTVASGVPLHVLDVPDPLNRATSLHGHLAIGNLLPELDGSEIAVAQGDPRIPVQIFNLNTGLNDPAATVQPASDMDTVTAVATTY